MIIFVHRCIMANPSIWGPMPSAVVSFALKKTTLIIYSWCYNFSSQLLYILHVLCLNIINDNRYCFLYYKINSVSFLSFFFFLPVNYHYLKLVWHKIKCMCTFSVYMLYISSHVYKYVCTRYNYLPSFLIVGLV